MREFEPESPTLTDDVLIPSYDASLKKLEAFRHSDSSSYTDHQDVFTAYPKALLNDQPAIVSSTKGPVQRASLADDQPWLLDSDVSDPFDYADFGNNGNSTGPENQQFGIGSTEWNSLSSETSYLGPKTKAVIVEPVPQHPSSPDDGPFSDLEDADFSALDPPVQQVLPHRPKPSTRPHAPPPQPAPPRKPIVRPPFPDPVNARSLVHGVSAATVLRTCFRIGEALRAGSRAVHAADDVVIELYARVASSAREGSRAPASSLSSPVGSGRQDFTFVDLFHDRPPYLKGVYDLWKGAELWDAESREFLDAGGRAGAVSVRGEDEEGWQGVTFDGVQCAEGLLGDDVDHTKAIVCGP